jgi:hypothetical protein
MQNDEATTLLLLTKAAGGLEQRQSEREPRRVIAIQDSQFQTVEPAAIGGAP